MNGEEEQIMQVCCAAASMLVIILVMYFHMIFARLFEAGMIARFFIAKL